MAEDSRPLLRVDPALLPRPPLVDVHVHLATDGGPGLPVACWSPLAREAGVRVAAVFPPTRTGGYTAANLALQQQAAASGGTIRAFARLRGPVPLTVPAGWQLRRALRSRVGPQPEGVTEALRSLAGADGVKMLPHLDGFPPEPVLEEIAARQLPVLVHAGEHVPPALIERMLVRRLRGPVIVGHLGSFPASAPHLEAALALARTYDHVYLETSASWLAEFVALAARAVPDKLLFGSDTPLMHPGVAWAHVAAAIPDDELCADVGHRTAEAVLGW